MTREIAFKLKVTEDRAIQLQLLDRLDSIVFALGEISSRVT